MKVKKPTASDYIPRFMARTVYEIETGIGHVCISDEQANEMIRSGKCRRATEEEVAESAEAKALEAAEEYTPEIVTEEEANRWALAAMVRDWKAEGYESQQELLDNVPQQHHDKLTAIEGMIGGLTLLRVAAEHGDGWINDGMGVALDVHFDAIAEILEMGRKAYAENVARMRAATA